MSSKPVHILVVEDSLADLRLIEEAFAEARIAHRLSVARDGAQALEVLARRDDRPDLVTLDLNLPGMSGREVLERIKADHALRRIPVVVLSTSCSDTDVRESYDLHANCYITKPDDFAGFVDVVRAIHDFWLRVVRLPGHSERAA